MGLWVPNPKKCLVSHLILITVFNDLRAQVAAGNCSQVLLVALAITGIFVQHVRCPRLNLCADDVVPQLPRWNHPPTSAFSLVSMQSPDMAWSLRVMDTLHLQFTYTQDSYSADPIVEFSTFPSSLTYVSRPYSIVPVSQCTEQARPTLLPRAQNNSWHQWTLIALHCALFEVVKSCFRLGWTTHHIKLDLRTFEPRYTD